MNGNTIMEFLRQNFLPEKQPYVQYMHYNGSMQTRDQTEPYIMNSNTI